MDRATLTLRLEAPMQSWGRRSRWDVRDSGREPSKSGVIGLLGCALGLRRMAPRLIELEESLLFGVRVDRAGTLGIDYQTVQGYHRTGHGEFKHADGTAKKLAKAVEHDPYTTVSPREVLYDASFLVGLEGEVRLLDELAESILRPKWPLYLGRKAFVPSIPLGPKVTGAALLETLKSHPLAQPHGDRPALIVEEAAWTLNSNQNVHDELVRLTDDPNRNYGVRRLVRSDFPAEEATS